MDDVIADDVSKHGWSLLSIADEPPFVYTVGLMLSASHPELIMFGLDSSNAGALFSNLIDSIKAGASFREPGIRTVTIGGAEHRIGIRKVDPTQHQFYLGFAMGFLREGDHCDELEAVQIYWPDERGKFPFEPNCDLAVFELQPRLDIAKSLREILRFERQFE